MFLLRAHLPGIQAKFVYEGHRVQIKVIGSKVPVYFSDNLQPIATRGKKARGTLLVNKHCRNGCSIKPAPLCHYEISGGHIWRTVVRRSGSAGSVLPPVGVTVIKMLQCCFKQNVFIFRQTCIALKFGLGVGLKSGLRLGLQGIGFRLGNIISKSIFGPLSSHHRQYVNNIIG